MWPHLLTLCLGLTYDPEAWKERLLRKVPRSFPIGTKLSKGRMPPGLRTCPYKSVEEVTSKPRLLTPASMLWEVHLWEVSFNGSIKVVALAEPHHL